MKEIPFPKLELDSTSSPVESERQKRKCDHGVILKVVTTNICGSDQHMVRGYGIKKPDCRQFCHTFLPTRNFTTS